MKRKITSLLLALVMTLALAVPAFASSETYYDAGSFAAPDQNTSTMVFAATTRVPKISLSLPQLADNPVVFNPYQISYTSDTDTLNGHAVTAASGSTNADQTKQVISPIYDIVNLSDAQLTVGVKATTTVDGNLTLVGTDPSNSETKNAAHIRVDFATTEANTDLTTATWLKNDAEQKLFTSKDTVNTGISGVTWKSQKSLDLVSGTKAAEIKVTDPAPNNLVLPLTTATDEDLSKASHLLFQFAGAAAKNPTNAWTSGDKFTTTLVFTFQPGVAATDATSSQNITVTSANAGDTSVQFSTPTFSDAQSGTTYTWGNGAAESSGTVTVTCAALTAGSNVALTERPTVSYTNSNGGTTTVTFVITVTTVS